MAATHIAAIVGSICTHTYLCYVYAKSKSIFVPSIAHIALNNASRTFTYFIVIQKQFAANIAQYLAMVLIVALLYYRAGTIVFLPYAILGFFRAYYANPS